jgi:hypothetical protein
LKPTKGPGASPYAFRIKTGTIILKLTYKVPEDLTIISDAFPHLNPTELHKFKRDLLEKKNPKDRSIGEPVIF